ncbi:MAG: DUF1934 domain-containing protein [Candidatus Gastranaerophilales bacterium]|nr:DUF1934 domain-containing protein [Candidatus Gastranaerophilales bacterium]
MDKRVERVELTIRGLHAEDGAGITPLETVTWAEYFNKNNNHYLLYQEKQEGMESPSKCQIKFAPGLLELNRQGAVATRMVFEEGKKHLSHYFMPYGELLLGIDTKSVSLEEQEDRVRVGIDYSLEINGEHQSDSRIEILVRNPI